MYTHLLLDLDGTLIDSSSGIYHAFAHACYNLGLPSPDYTNFCLSIGPPVQQIAKNLYPFLDPKSLEQFRSSFRQEYDLFSFSMAEWYPDVLNTLVSLCRDPNLRISIVTNKPTAPAVKLTKAAAVEICFSRIVGIDYRVFHRIGPIFSSKADALTYVLSTDSSANEHHIYIGDTPSDQDACEHCQIPFIAALYGFHRWNTHKKPAICLERFGDIITVLQAAKL
jgi:phosphoglycolate phosphatase